MAKQRLVVRSDDSGQFFLLIDGDMVTVGGARANASTVLQNLRVVNVHCVLEVEGDHVTVRNDEPAGPGMPREMRPNEVHHANGSELCLQVAAAPTVVKEPGLAPVEEPAASSPAASNQSGLRLKKRLLVIDGADQGQVFILPDTGTVTLGKDRKYADIILHDLYVARNHCRIRIAADKVEVIDDDAHGMQVNGKKVNRQDLGLGDVLRIGNTHMRLEAVVAGEEIAKFAGSGAPAAAADEDDEPIELTVVEEDAEEEDAEEEEALPANASEAVRLLYAWRAKLAQLSGQFGHYKLGEVLGRGRCGVVFRAEDVKTGQAVALKVFSPQFPQGNEELQRFAAGMKSLLPLRHPNLVGLLGAGKTGAYTWVAREYVDGESVARVIRRLAKRQQFDEKRAYRVAVHVARALEFARQQRLRHGKINPANVLIRKSGQVVKLADLMLGSVLQGSQLGRAVLEHRTAAELGYLAPEQADPGAFVDELSDTYGLGAVVYGLMTGRAPFVGDTAEEVLEKLRGSARVPRLSTINPEAPPALEQIVMKMLARRQEDRYQTLAELLTALKPIAEELGVEA
jgi:Protein kinase domain/Inner membrane component of T3SS, cytoplasmic domain